MVVTEPTEKTVAFVLYPGVTAFDLAGPLEVIARLAGIRPEIRPVVVGERSVATDTDAGVQIAPQRLAGKIAAPLITAAPRRLTRAEVGSSSITDR